MTDTYKSNRKYNFKCLKERPAFMSPKASHDGLKGSPDGLKGSPDGLKASPVPVSTLGKRKFHDAFESETFDDSRYGQHISSDFFDKNVGHNSIQISEERKIFTLSQEKEILEWCEYYLANKNLFNV